MLESDEAIEDYLATQPLYRHICSTRDNLVEETRYLEWKNTQALEKRDNFQMPKLKEAKKKLKKINEQLALAQKEKSELLSKVKPENLTKIFIPAVEEKLRRSEAIRLAFLRQEISLNECLSEYIAERKAYYVRRAKTNFITALAKSV
jgi:cobalamin-dependent methionine synthase I